MLKLISKGLANQELCQSDIKESIEICEEKFRHILSEILEGGSKEAHKVEASIFKRLMELGLLLLNLFFIKQNQGNYGERIKTSKGIAKRGRVSGRAYFSIFGKLRIERYMYHIGAESFAQLDILLNLPNRCYSYFLSEMVNLLDIKGAYAEGVMFLEKFFNITLSVSAAETISDESAMSYENYYDSRDSSYTINLNIRTPEEVANNLVFPENTGNKEG